jgi:hypothetical protein
MEMNEKKYELVAWTRNTGNGEVEVRMTPELHHQAQEHLFKGIAECRRKGNSALLQKVHLLEQSGDFNLMTGHYGEGLRFLRAAALACLEPDSERTVLDHESGSYPYFSGRTRWEFLRLYGKFHKMVRKFSRTDILMEKESGLLKDLYEGQAHIGKGQ